MFNKRLMKLLDSSMVWVKKTVVFNLLALVMNILFLSCFAALITFAWQKRLEVQRLAALALLMGAALLIRAYLEKKSTRCSYLAARDVKVVLREKIYLKLLSLGMSYQQQCSTSEVVQVAMEGVDQLETYFGRYLPQLFTSLLSPLILFVLLLFFDWRAAVVLLVCVPLIPMSIVAVQKFAKKLLSRYWGAYTGLGDSFLENLQGLTTLKIYEADERKTAEMDVEAEHFRKITMKVLTMQLNSISVMDLVAYGGAAVGFAVALFDFRSGAISLFGCLLVLLLASEFFIPLRLLGSYFHIAMNGMAASDKIFRLLDLEEHPCGDQAVPFHPDIRLSHVSFSYDPSRVILKDLSLDIPYGSFLGVVGQSGCGKSTLAGLLSASLRGYEGEITAGDIRLEELRRPADLLTLVSHNNHLFKGTLRENLLLACPKARDEQLIDVLNEVNFWEFAQNNGGLDMMLLEGASNLSGGQRQRVNLARALLKDTPVYLFDEATSNIDMESENDILQIIRSLKKKKTVIMISHRLDYCADCDQILYLRDGVQEGLGSHQELLNGCAGYRRLHDQQQALIHSLKKGETLCAEAE